MKNDFSEKTRNLFDQGGWAEDWEDGRNDADCLHHILGRVSSSPYNAAPLNNFRNHQPEGRSSRGLAPLSSDETIGKYLNKTADYLANIGYLATDEDMQFLNKHNKYYNAN